MMIRYAVCVLVLVFGAQCAPENKELEELQLESRSCNKQINMGKSKCLSTTNCCYFSYYEPKLENFIPQCIGMKTFKRFYVKNETTYLEKTGKSAIYSSLKNENFCDIISGDSEIGKVKDCACISYINNIYSVFILVIFGVLVM